MTRKLVAWWRDVALQGGVHRNQAGERGLSALTIGLLIPAEAGAVKSADLTTFATKGQRSPRIRLFTPSAGPRLRPRPRLLQSVVSRFCLCRQGQHAAAEPHEQSSVVSASVVRHRGAESSHRSRSTLHVPATTRSAPQS
eukprot:6341615-Prymnesium_polylepis.2